jgi:hypothetical protein
MADAPNYVTLISHVAQTARPVEPSYFGRLIVTEAVEHDSKVGLYFQLLKGVAG